MMNASRLSWMIRVLAVLIVAIGLATMGLGEQALAAEDLEWDTKLTYRLKVDEGTINLVSDISLTNKKGNQRRGNTITRFYMDRTWIYVPVEATNLSVMSGDKELTYSIDEEVDDENVIEGLSLLEIRFPKRIFYNRSVDIRVEYDIPGDDPRTDSLFRVNPAYSSFSVIAWGDPGRIEVVVILDSQFEIDAWGSEFDRSRDGSDVIYTITEIEEPAEWFMIFTARNDDQLAESLTDLVDFDVNVRSWPSDEWWAAEIETSVETGLPVMYELIGLDWRPDNGLEIRESIEPTLLGYGGWYLDTGDVIEIGEYVDPHLVLHEIGHSWFNEDLFIHRWITEGLADQYAYTTLETLNWSEKTEYILDDDPPYRQGPYSTALNDWVFPDFDGEDVEDTEDYGYVTSWWVINEITEEIGIEALSAVIAAADADQIAYVDRGTPESVQAEDDWRRFLDLLQEVGGSEIAPDLFEERVLGEADSLDERAAARGTYVELLEDSGDWTVPIAIRGPMSDWDFDSATVQMTSASEVLDVRDEIEVLAETLGIVPPVSLRDEYEATDSGFESSLLLALDQRTAAETVLRAKEAVETEPGILEQIGLMGEDPDSELAEAVTALESDDLGTATAEAEDALALMAAAESVGTSRTAKASGGLFAFLLLIIGMVVLVRRRRRRRRDRVTDIDSLSDETLPADGTDDEPQTESQNDDQQDTTIVDDM